MEEAFADFDDQKHAFAVSKLKRLLEENGEDSHAKFDLAILILSAKYPDQVPFCSPELRNCIDAGKNHLTHNVADSNKWGRGKYAEDYALFENHCNQVLQKMGTTAAQDIEKLAYVLDRWSALKGRQSRRET